MPLEKEIEAWVRDHVEPVGAIEFVHTQPWAAVWRVPLAGRDAWLKVCEPPQDFEPGLTAALASRRRDLLPEVLGHEDRRGWLLLAGAGSSIGLEACEELWLSLLPRYAELQRGETEHADEHLAGGVPDRRLETFPALFDALVARELPLDDAETSRLRAFAPRFAGLCAELEERGPSATIEHRDLHGANVCELDGQLRILDWGDAAVSHPFLTFFVAFLHLERTAPSLPRLRDAYLEPWGRTVELRETFELAQRLGVFAHLFKELPVWDAYPPGEGIDFTEAFRELLDRCLAAAARN